MPWFISGGLKAALLMFIFIGYSVKNHFYVHLFSGLNCLINMCVQTFLSSKLYLRTCSYLNPICQACMSVCVCVCVCVCACVSMYVCVCVCGSALYRFSHNDEAGGLCKQTFSLSLIFYDVVYKVIYLKLDVGYQRRHSSES